MKKASKLLRSHLGTFLSNHLKFRLSQALYKIGYKPVVNKKAKSPFKKGIIVFSGDFELSWAWRYAKKNKNFLEIAQRERKNTPAILELLDIYEIPITWAIVGHLFLDQCKRENSQPPHADLLRPQYLVNRWWRFESGDWYDHDPCSDLNNAPEWYAPDLIEKILQAKVKHEIACHSFSHIDFSNKNCPPELADSEIKKCLEVAQKFNIKLESMVFPGNTHGNFHILKERGFICYRKHTQFDIDIPTIDRYGLVVIPESSMLDKYPCGWSKDFYTWIYRKYVEVAIEHGLVCHFWFHPSMNEWYLDHIFPSILKYASKQAAQKRIEIMTMKDLAQFILDSSRKE